MSSSESESWSRLIQRVVRTKNQEKNNNVTYSQKGLKKIVRKLEAINAAALLLMIIKKSTNTINQNIHTNIYTTRLHDYRLHRAKSAA